MDYDERVADEGEGNEQEMEEQAVEEELENESAAVSLEPPKYNVGAGLGRLAGGAVRSTGSALSGLGGLIAPAPSGEAPEREDPAADDLDDLFEGPQPEDNDMAIDHLVAVPDEEELDDLLDVDAEDIMGEAPPPRVRRTGRPYIPRGLPPSGLGGMRG